MVSTTDLAGPIPRVATAAFPPPSKKGDRGGFALRAKGKSPVAPFSKGGKQVPRLLVSTALTIALAACTVGPDDVRPDTYTPGAFVRAESTVATKGDTTQPQASAAEQVEFWRSFGDAQLTGLVEDALSYNHDLKIALARYDRANALLRGAKFDTLPTITASGEASDSRASTDQAAGGPRDGKSYSAGIDAVWELDLFGRIRRGVEANRAEAAASAADLQALQVAIVGEVARTYVELCGLQERLRVARENAENQRETLRIVDARLDAGRGTEFDSARARAQLQTTQSRVPALEAQVAVSMHRLAVLSGRTPDALVAQLEPQQPLPALPGKLDPGTPGELLRRRPDIAVAEQRLHAATARVGVATADLFPRFTLGGLLGSQAIDSGDLFEGGRETRFVALGVDWSFLDIGRTRARIAAADADAEGELARYRQAVLLALEDTENALVRYARARSEDAHLERAAIDSASAARLARIRFDAGAAGLLEVLDAERTQLVAQDAFADARTRSVGGAVAVYEALAGGWSERMPVREKLADAGR